MECRMLHSASFTGSVCHPNCVSWSDDNKLVVCIEKGVYVMSTNHIPFESDYPLTFHQQGISAFQEILIFDVKVNRALLHSKLPTDDEHAMMLDHTISPLTANASHFLTFKSAHWSPVGVIDEGCCILAVLTMDHRLILYREVGNKWSSLIDLSVKFYNQHKEIWEKDKQEESTETRDISFMLQQMKERTYKLAAINMTWTQKFSSLAVSTSDENITFCFLIVAMKSGHIIFWKVVSVEMIEVVAEWDSKLGYISSLCWQQTHHNSGFLILGANSGRIVLLPVWITAEGGELEFGENEAIWIDEDLISVSQILVMKQSDSSYIVVATKDIYLISCEVIVQESDVIVRKIGHIKGHYSLSATGLCRRGNEVPHSKLALTSRDGRTIALSVKNSIQNITIDQEEILVDVEIDKLAPQGICCSRNGTLFAVLYNIPIMYDCHVTREPLKLVIFTMTSLKEIASNLVKCSDSNVRNTSICNQFSQLFDYLDSLHAHLALGFSIPPILEDLILCDVKSLDKQRLIRLQLIRHMAKVLLLTLSSSDEQCKKIKERLEMVESLIMRQHIFTIIGKFQNKLMELSDRQKQSMLLMNDWLRKQFNMVVQNIYPNLGEKIPESPNLIPCREKCRICKEEVPLEKIQYGECPKSHKFGRCCKSLLLCDSNYQKCKSCKILCSSPAVWYPDPFCTFCNDAIR